MAGIKIDRRSIVSIVSIALFGLVSVSAVFLPKIQQAQSRLDHVSASLLESQAIQARRTALLGEWESKKSLFYPGYQPDAALNAWIKELLGLAQAEGVSLEKLEPAGIKTDSAGTRLSVLVSFKGDMRKFTQFAYRLLESDPLAFFESLAIRQNEDSKMLSFEWLLTKVLP